MVKEIQKFVGEIESRGLGTDEEEIVTKESSLSNLHDDMLSQILARLFAGDRAAFLSSCKSLRSLYVSPTRRFKLPFSSSPDCRSPCLLLSNNRIIHPIYDECNHMGLVREPCAQILMAKNDWLLMYKRQRELFFFNAFMGTIIEIPSFPHLDIRSVCFSSLPTSTDWQIVAGSVNKTDKKIIIYSINYGDDSWNSIEYDIDVDFSFCNAVIHKGSYYFLDKEAKVLIYNHKSKTVQFYKASKCISEKFSATFGQRYLLESNEGKLMAIFVSYDGSWIRTCQWDDYKKTWEIVRSLGNKMLFVSRPFSLCEVASVQGTGNKIYFPRLIDGHCLFYSLSTKRYHTFTSGSSYENFYASKFHLDATWVINKLYEVWIRDT